VVAPALGAGAAGVAAAATERVAPAAAVVTGLAAAATAEPAAVAGVPGSGTGVEPGCAAATAAVAVAAGLVAAATSLTAAEADASWAEAGAVDQPVSTAANAHARLARRRRLRRDSDRAGTQAERRKERLIHGFPVCCCPHLQYKTCGQDADKPHPRDGAYPWQRHLRGQCCQHQDFPANRMFSRGSETPG
jgi:hypothetical protein